MIPENPLTNAIHRAIDLYLGNYEDERNERGSDDPPVPSNVELLNDLLDHEIREGLYDTMSDDEDAPEFDASDADLDNLVLDIVRNLIREMK